MTDTKGQMFKIEGESYSWNWLLGSGLCFSVGFLLIVSYCRLWFGNKDVQPAGYWGGAVVFIGIGILFIFSHLSMKGKYIVVEEDRLSLTKGPGLTIKTGEFTSVINLKAYRNSSGFTCLYEVKFDTGVTISFGSQTEGYERLTSIIQDKSGQTFS